MGEVDMAGKKKKNREERPLLGKDICSWEYHPRKFLGPDTIYRLKILGHRKSSGGRTSWRAKNLSWNRSYLFQVS